ncbi:MAG: DUF3784 domain-containing protein [Oscillospiraceae bacterium]|jgi:hypothetical protein|nr:DUF3784 domain-containing protein [Oscillospiraceae bacterium]
MEWLLAITYCAGGLIMLIFAGFFWSGKAPKVYARIEKQAGDEVNPAKLRRNIGLLSAASGAGMLIAGLLYALVGEVGRHWVMLGFSVFMLICMVMRGYAVEWAYARKPEPIKRP